MVITGVRFSRTEENRNTSQKGAKTKTVNPNHLKLLGSQFYFSNKWESETSSWEIFTAQLD
jgi:hypothetical protein